MSSHVVYLCDRCHDTISPNGGKYKVVIHTEREYEDPMAIYSRTYRCGKDLCEKCALAFEEFVSGN
jgi:hypothetical protein